MAKQRKKYESSSYGAHKRGKAKRIPPIGKIKTIFLAQEGVTSGLGELLEQLFKDENPLCNNPLLLEVFQKAKVLGYKFKDLVEQLEQEVDT